MPELPEVETIRRDLEPRLRGRRVTGFDLLPGAERLLRGVPASAFRNRLVGRAIRGVGRHGKYLLLHLDDDSAWIIHLRMTGSLRHRTTDDPPDSFLRARIPLDDGTELRFTDIRKFGTFDIADDSVAALAKLGPDALDTAFDPDAMWAGLRGRRAPIKSMLLDQRLVAGIGNIYADEALFLAHLHPETPAGSLRPPERLALHHAIIRVLQDGISNRGASFRDYTDADGAMGSQQYFVRVFRRTDLPCDDCAAVIRRSVVGGRASHWCPRCQPAAQVRRKVGSRPRLRRSRTKAGSPS
jgi:formamidopyrimidine-DNA glycosylase